MIVMKVYNNDYENIKLKNFIIMKTIRTNENR